VRWPDRVAAGSRSDVLLSTVDIMPTLLGLCGLGVPEGVQGADLSRTLLARVGPTPDSQYLMNMGVGWPDRTEWMGFWRGVRTERWTYARWLEDARPRMLFDRRADPYQMTNLAGRPEHAETERALESRLRRWIEATGDPFETARRDSRTGMALLGQEFASDRWPVG
jgi:arylsulfatase A-like enzyme